MKKKLFFGFINTNESTVGSYTYIAGTSIEVKYYAPVNVIVENSFNSGSVIVDGTSYDSGTPFKWVYNSNHVIENYDQTIGNIFYDFKYWTFGTSTISTSNSWSVSTTTDRTYTAIFDTYNNVKFANRDISTEVPNTKLTILNNNDEVNSGDRRSIKVLESRNVKTNHETLPAASNKKHNRWNSNKSDFKLQHNLVVTPEIFEDYAQFEPLQPVTVTISLDGVPVSAPIEIKDPWFVEKDGSQPGNWKSYSTGFTPATMPNGGVFLNEDGQVPNPYYSARVNASQTTLGGSVAWFQTWSGPTGTVRLPTNLETAVIFKNANDVIKANYKGNLRTGSPELGDPVI